jgi:uncharacterized protein YegP (UPF0339 family)
MKRPRFKVYMDMSGEYRWRLQSRNSKVLADSAESYTRRRDAVRAVATFVNAVWDAQDDTGVVDVA